MSVDVEKVFMSDLLLTKNFQQNYFELFDMKVSYNLDLSLLESNYRRAQKQVHPDRYVLGSQMEKRLAVQFSSFVNEAYIVLKSPVRRALYLLSMRNVDVDFEKQSLVAPGFIMRQMELREELAAIRSGVDVDESLLKLRQEIGFEFEKLEIAFNELLLVDSDDSYKQAVKILQKMFIVDKLIKEIEQNHESLFI